MRSPVRLIRAVGALLLLPTLASAGQIVEIVDLTRGHPVVPGLALLEKDHAYAVHFAQSAGDPPIRGVHIPLPPSFSVSVSGPGGGGDILLDLSALGGSWTFTVAGGHVNLLESGTGVASGSFQILFKRVPAGTEVGFAHAAFSQDGAAMPAALLIPHTPGDELRLPSLVLDHHYNRLQLDNEADLFSTLSVPTIGSDPTEGDFSGDYYTKVFPAQVLLHPTGSLTVNALEYFVFDQDWDLDDATLWAYALTVGVESSDTGGGGSGAHPGLIEPLFTDPAAVFAPPVPEVGLGNPNGPGNCPPIGMTSGWQIVETYVDTSTGVQVPVLELVADGATDYVFTHFAPDGQSVFSGGVSCGGGGNATLSYLLSTDFFGLPMTTLEGENQTDWLGTGYSAFGGYRVAQSGAGLLPDGVDETAVVRLRMQEAMLNLHVDAGLDGGLTEMGLAGLNLPVGMDALGMPTGTQPKLGMRIYSDAAAPTMPGANATRLGLVWATLAQPLPAPGIPLLGGFLMLNPADPVFFVTSEAWGSAPYVGFDTDGDMLVDETYFATTMIPMVAAPSLLDLALHVQGLEFRTNTSTADTTQVVKLRLRPND